MSETTFKIKSRTETFRVRKMSAVEFLALRSIASNDTIDDAIKFFQEILNDVEVNVGPTWFKVFDKEAKTYYPANIEDDAMAISEIIEYFTESVMKPVFTKSNGSET